jgi:hypothetical protein
MGDLNVERCPETGICSIVKADGKKIDLMPEEAAALTQARGDTGAICKVLAAVDPEFADSLEAEELAQLSAEMK